MQYYLPRRTYRLETRFFAIVMPAFTLLMLASWIGV